MGIDLSPVQRAVDAARSGLESIFTELATIRDRILSALRTLIESVLPSLLEAFGGAIAAFGELTTGLLDRLASLDDVGQTLWNALWQRLFDDTERELAPQLRALFAEQRVLERMPESLRALLSNATEPQHYVWGPMLLGAAIALLGIAATAPLEGLRQSLVRESYATFQPEPPPTSVLTDALARGIIDQQKFDEWMARLGYAEDVRTAIYRTSLTPPFSTHLIDAYLNGSIDRVELRESLLRLGWTAEAMRAAIQAQKARPSPQDIVVMTGREVFEEELAQRLQLDAEFDQVRPPEFVERYLPRELLKLYWRAHWDEVPLSHAFEMWHRNIIDDDTLDAIFKQHEVLPWVREAYQQWSYNLLTRVDVRRMHQLNEMTDDEVVAYYQSLGYKREDAERLMRFSRSLKERSEQTNRQRTAAATRKALYNAYRRGTMSRDEVVAQLTAFDIDADEIARDLALIDVDEEAERANAVVTPLGKLVTRGFIDIDQARSELAQRGFEQREIERIVERWSLELRYRERSEAESAQRDLTKSEILLSYRESIIDAVDAATALQQLGYDEREAAALLRLEDVKRARVERERSERAVRSLFVRGTIDENEAARRLSDAGVADDRAAALIADWTLERDERRPDISLSDLRAAVEAGLIGADVYEQRLAAVGYTSDDAALLRALEEKRVAIAEEKLQLEREKLEFQKARENQRRAAALEQIAARIDGQLRVLQQRVESSERQLTRKLESQQALLDRRLAAQRQIEEQRAELQQRRIAAQSESEQRRLSAQERLLERRLAAQRELSERQIAARAELEQQRATLRERLEQTKTQRQLAIEARREAAAAARDVRRAVLQLQRELVGVERRAAESEAAAAGLRAAQDRILALVRELSSQVTTT